MLTNPSFGAIVSLTIGMILMFVGFFMYVASESQIISVAVMLSGAFCECFGFYLAYLGYKSAIRKRKQIL